MNKLRKIWDRVNYGETSYHILLVCILTISGFLLSHGDSFVTLIIFFISLGLVDSLKYEKIISLKNREIAELKMYKNYALEDTANKLQQLAIEALKEEQVLESKTE